MRAKYIRWFLVVVSDWETELNSVCQMLKVRLEILQDSGHTYIQKNSESKEIGVKIDHVEKQNKLNLLKTELINCQKCKLCNHRTNIVFGEGSPVANIIFVGEAPGEKEDLSGEPFVGRAGMLLTKMINAMGFERSDVYICNVIKCRPPANRDPEADEIASCEPFLRSQIAAINPKVIIGLGRHACQTLLKTKSTMASIRGQWQEYEGIKFMPTFHPAYLLRNPPAKKFVWEDLQAVLKVI